MVERGESVALVKGHQILQHADAAVGGLVALDRGRRLAVDEMLVQATEVEVHGPKPQLGEVRSCDAVVLSRRPVAELGHVMGNQEGPEALEVGSGAVAEPETRRG